MKERMYVDFHVLQTVPPSCVNRDDMGQPKTATYGGTTRARVSSQSWKYAIRERFMEIFPKEQVGIRTRRLIDLIAGYIREENPEIDEKEAAKRAQTVLEAVGFKFKSKNEDENPDDDEKKADKKSRKKTENDKTPNANAVFFISKAQAMAIAKIAAFHSGTTYSKEEKQECVKALQENPSIDIALFGRMLAGNSDLKTDASVQVAHAISTHAVNNEYDDFTAVDDYTKDDNTGAGHMGTAAYNSCTMYRFASLNVTDLNRILQGTDTAEVVREFAEAFICSMPAGKQNSFASATLPDVVYITIRKDRPVNLCGAFEKAIKPSESGNAEPSADALKQYAKNLYEDYDAPEKAMTVGRGMEEIAEKMSFHKLLDTLEEEVSNATAGKDGELTKEAV